MKPDALARALQPDLAIEALRRAGGCDADEQASGLLVERVHFSDKRPPVIRYRLDGAKGQKEILAELVDDPVDHAEAERIRLAKRRRRQTAKGAPVFVLPDEQAHLVFRQPGLDAKLPGLRWLTRPDDVAAALVTTGLAKAPSQITTRLRAHRLGKRAVIQIDYLEDGEPCRIFARARATSSEAGRLAYARHCRLAEAINGDAALHVPAPLAFIEQNGVALLAAVPGRALDFSQTIDRCKLQQALQAIDRLQQKPLTGLPDHSIADELSLLETATGRLGVVYPDLVASLSSALAGLATDMQRLPVIEPVPTHRDLHEEQVLIAGAQVAILDLDTACLADPMLDYGNLLAHARLAELRFGRPEETLMSLVEAAAGRKYDPHRLDLWRRAALLRLATVHGFATGAQALAASLIDEASR